MSRRFDTRSVVRSIAVLWAAIAISASVLVPADPVEAQQPDVAHAADDRAEEGGEGLLVDGEPRRAFGDRSQPITPVPSTGIEGVEQITVGSASAREAAATATDSGLTFHRVEPCVVFDSRSASDPDLDGVFLGGESRTVEVTGTPANQGATSDCGIPNAAAAVWVRLVALGALREGNLRVAEAGVAPSGGVLNFAANDLINSNSVVVPLSVDGRIDVSANAGGGNVGAETAHVQVVVLAWLGDPASQTGSSLIPVTACAVADSRSNQGSAGRFIGPHGDGAVVDFQVSGTIPASQGGGNDNCLVPAGASAVLVNVVAVNPTGSGSLSLGIGGEEVPSLPVVSFAALSPSMNNSATSLVPLSGTGQARIGVTSDPGTSVEFRVVVLGYLQPHEVGAPTYVPLNACAFFDTRANQSAAGVFAGARDGGESTRYKATGAFSADQGGGNTACGVPAEAAGVFVNLVATNAEREGNLRGAPAGVAPAGGVVNFAPLTPRMNNSNAVFLPLSPEGEIDISVNGGPVGFGLPVTEIRGVILGYLLQPPSIADQAFLVAEDVPVGSTVGTVVLSNPTIGAPFSFALDDTSVFEIDSATGEITTAAVLDFETTSEYSAIVTVTNAGGLISEASVTIMVDDVGEAPAVVVDSHTGGELVDIGLLGRVPTLSGTAEVPGGTISTVEVSRDGGEAAPADLVALPDGSVRWSIPFGAPASGPVTFDIVADDGFGNTGSDTISLDVQLPDPTPPVYAARVVELSDGVLDTLLPGGVTADELRFDTDPAVEVGQVLLAPPISEAPEGFAFRVTGVRVEASGTVVQVAQAELDEIFAAVAIDIVDGVVETSSAPRSGGAELRSGDVAQSLAAAGTVSLPDVNVGGNPVTIGAVQVTPAATVTSQLTYSLDVRVNWLVFPPQPAVHDIKAIVSGEAVGTAEFSFQLDGRFERKEVLLEPTTVLRTVVVLPGVPTPIPLEVDFGLEVDAKATVTELRATSNYEVRIPFSGGFELGPNGQLQPVSSAGFSGSISPATSSVSGRVDAGLDFITSFDLHYFKGPFSYQRGFVSFGLDMIPAATGAVWIDDPGRPPCYFLNAGYRVNGRIAVGFGLLESGDQELLADLETVDQDRKICREEEEDEGGSWGDPHILTLDQLVYPFQAAGDYVLVESLSDDWQVQVRLTRPSQQLDSVSYNRAVAATVGDSVLSFGDDATTGFAGPMIPRLDGVQIFPDEIGVLLPGGVTIRTQTLTPGASNPNIRRTPTQWAVRWPDGSELIVDQRTARSVMVRLGTGRAGDVRGLLGDDDGDPNDDLRTAVGIDVDPYDMSSLYGVFATDWRRTGAESLFLTPLTDLPAGEVFPSDPTILASLANLPVSEVTSAEQECLDAGVEPGAGLIQCTFDVATVGDSAIIVADAGLADVLQLATPAAALAVGVEDDITIDGSTVVDGSLDGAFVRDVIRVDLEAGADISVEGISECPGVTANSTFRATIAAPSGLPVATSSGAGCGRLEITGVQQSGEYVISVYDQGGFTGVYKLDVDIPGPPVVEGGDYVIALNDEAGSVLGNVEATDSDSPTLTFALDDSAVVDVDRLTGEIRLVSRDQLESLAPSFDLVVTVTDADGNSDTATLTFLIEQLRRSAEPLFPRELFSLGPRPETLELHDLTGDGILDVIAVSRTANEVSLLEGLGQGRYEELLASTVGERPAGLALGDFDGDGNLDLAVANENSEDVSVLLATGAGFADEIRIGLEEGLAPTDVTTADVVGDSSLDLLVTTVSVGQGTTDQLVLLEGDGSGGFVEHSRLTVGRFPKAVQVGDITGDGAIDIVTANSASDDLSFLASAAEGGFEAEVRLGPGATQAVDVEIVDHGADGDLDLVALFDSGVHLFDWGSPTGTFTVSGPFAVEQTPSDLFVGDINQDQVFDVVVSNELSNSVSVLLGNGTGFDPQGVLEQSEIGVQRPTALAIAEVTDDLLVDLVVAGAPGSGELTVIGSPFGGVTSWPSEGEKDVVLADVTGDGLLDVVTLAPNTNRVLIYPDRPDGFGIVNSVNSGSPVPGEGNRPIAVAAGLIDDDNNVDIVTVNALSNDISVLLGNGVGGFDSPLFFDVGDGPRNVELGDVSGDGLTDIVVVNHLSNDLTLLLGQSGGTLAAPQQLELDGDGPVDASINDVTGDGINDIIVTNQGSESVEVVTQDPAGPPDVAQFDCTGLDGEPNPDDPDGEPLPVDCSPSWLVSGDLNGDGQLDIVVAYRGVNELAVVLADADGDLVDDESIGVPLRGGFDGASMELVDVNSDGALDIVVSSSGTAVVLNDGFGGFGAARRFGIGGQFAVGDITQDGKPDLVTIGDGTGVGAGGSGPTITLLEHL